jgi:hypothetical protein
MDGIFLAIAGGTTKTSDQLKHDLKYDHLINEIRQEQTDPECTKQTLLLKERDEKMYRIAGVDVSATEAEDSIKSIDMISKLPREYKQPLTEEEKLKREREAFERRFGVNFDDAVNDLLEKDRKMKKKAPDQPKRTNLGPFEGW